MGTPDAWDAAPPGRATRIIVDLDAIEGNVRYFRDAVSPGTAVMAVVKADGYGHGAVMVARAAVAAGARSLAVATVDEGIVLRRFGLDVPILVLGPIDLSEITAAIDATLTLTLADERFVPVLAHAARSSSGSLPLPVHVKVDTGMNRFGASPERSIPLCRRVIGHPELALTGVYSHFADADDSDERFTRSQAERFDAILSRVRSAGISPGVAHLSNSAGALRGRAYDYGMVRIGIALYGLSPSPAMTLPNGLRPALSLRSRISRVHDIDVGESVSYARTYVAERRERIGLVPIGYADGYRRGLSNQGVMAANGSLLPIRGRVCMDQCVVGIPEGSDLPIGAKVEIVSADVSAPNSVAGIASSLGTIDYEIVSGLSRRIPRYYTKGRRLVAVQDLHTVGLVPETL